MSTRRYTRRARSRRPRDGVLQVVAELLEQHPGLLGVPREDLLRSIAVSRLSPSELAVARRRDDRRRAVLDFVTAAVAASAAPR